MQMQRRFVGVAQQHKFSFFLKSLSSSSFGKSQYRHLSNHQNVYFPKYFCSKFSLSLNSSTLFSSSFVDSQSKQDRMSLSTKANNGTSATTSYSNEGHYTSHTAKSYEQAYFYEPGTYMNYLVQTTSNRLQLSSSSNFQNKKHVLLDIGGGTGNFAQALLDGYYDNYHQNYHKNSNDDDSASFTPLEIVIVDPFLEPGVYQDQKEQIDDDDNDEMKKKEKTSLKFVKEPAESFIIDSNTTGMTSTSDDTETNPAATADDWWKQQVTQILLKEVVHHFPSSESRIDIFKGMYHALVASKNSNRNDDGDDNTEEQESRHQRPSILIITRPQIDIDYPLWDDAYEVWKKNQPNEEELICELREAGFRTIQHTLESYPCSISLARWQSMIINRFWSTFSNFSNEQLHAACYDTIPKIHAHRLQATNNSFSNDKDESSESPILHFEDRLIFISACI